MSKKRVLVGYGIDVDAVAGWINTCNGSPQTPTNVSRGVFGATVGTDRLLKLWDEHNIKTTWFVPAHSIESFPQQLAKVRDTGHEMYVAIDALAEIGLHAGLRRILKFDHADDGHSGLHGYTHEHLAQLTAEQQRDVLVKSIDVLTKFCGKKPLGYTAPAWATSKELIPLLEEHGIMYDHSFMHHDVQPYYAPDSSAEWIETDLRKDAETWMRPMTKLKPSKVVEIPANWHLDDWPPLQPNLGRPAHGFVDTYVVEKLWMEQFDFAYREYDAFVFPMSIHPQVSGKPQVILMHERIIKHINKHEGVEWMTFGDMAKEFKDGNFAGVTIEGGADI